MLELPPEECASGVSVEELKIKRKELLEFVSEYGTADSLPELDSLRKFIAEEDLWPVNWKIFTRRGLHSDRLRKWTVEPASLEQMIAASQDYQAFVLKYHTEFFRRHKFAPCNGALFFQFRDRWPAVTASVVDYYGKRKKGYFALQQAFNPIHVMMDWPDLVGEPAGSTFRRAIYVVNDYAAAYPLLDRHVASARRRERRARQRNHHLRSARQLPATGRRSLMGHPRRRRQLPRDARTRTRCGTSLQQQLPGRGVRRMTQPHPRLSP